MFEEAQHHGGAGEVEFLLDSVSFSPLRAYSTRLLSSSYAGDALRVRRSSDNAELDIGFDGEDLDTAALLSFVGANDGFVRTVYDQSGNANNAGQSTAGSQWKIVSSGTLETLNGKASLLSDSTKLMTMLNINTTRSLFAVLRYNNLETSAPIIGHSTAFDYHGGSVASSWFWGSGTTKASVLAGDFYVNGVDTDGTAADTRVVDTDYQLALIQSAADGLINQWVADRGFGRGHAGQFPELIITDEDASSDRATVEANQSAYWGI